MSNKNDFEGPDFDSANIVQEDARIDALEVAFDRQRHVQQLQAFEQRVLSYAVDTCLNSCLDSLDLLYIPREANPISDVAVAHDSWRQEAEPEPCSRDSWLRGAIPETTALPRVQSTSTQLSVTNTTKDRPQSGLKVRRGGHGSVASTTAEEGPGQRRTTTSAGSNRSRPPAAISQPATRPSPSTAGKPSSSKVAGKQLTQEQQEAEARLRQELQIRRQQESIAKELKQKDEQARTALLSMQKELKGKDYTYDSTGKVVLLNKINPEALPAPPGPQFKVHATAAADAEATAAAAAAAKTAKSSSSTSTTLAATAAKAKSSKKSAGAGSSSSEYLQTASVTQPPVLETLRPAAGVTLRAGAAAKQGPKRDAGGQTRAQYQQQAKAQNQQAARIVRSAAHTAARVSTAGGAGTTSANSIRNSTASPVGSAAAATASSTSSRSSYALGASSISQARATAAATAASGRSSPSPAVVETNSRVSSAAAGALRPAPAAAAGGPKRPPSPDVNLVLVSAADWGVAAGGSYTPPDSAQLTKPDVKQIKEEFGRTTHLPKLRAHVATLKPPSAQPGSTVSTKTLLGTSQR